MRYFSPAIIFLLLVNLVAWGRVLTGCAAVTPVATAIAVDCGPSLLLSLIEDIVPVAEDLLAKNDTAALDALEKSFGDALICAVGVVETQAAPASAPARPVASTIAVNARAYLAARHKVPKNVPFVHALGRGLR